MLLERKEIHVINSLKKANRIKAKEIRKNKRLTLIEENIEHYYYYMHGYKYVLTLVFKLME